MFCQSEQSWLIVVLRHEPRPSQTRQNHNVGVPSWRHFREVRNHGELLATEGLEHARKRALCQELTKHTISAGHGLPSRDKVPLLQTFLWLPFSRCGFFEAVIDAASPSSPTHCRRTLRDLTVFEYHVVLIPHTPRSLRQPRLAWSCAYKSVRKQLCIYKTYSN